MDELIEAIKQSPSLVVSVCALLLTVYQARSTWKHNRLSVQPRLTTSTQTEIHPTDKTVTIVTASLINSGLGPAIINRFEVSVDNQHFPITEPEELVALMTKHLSGQLVLDQCTTSVLRKGHAMSKDAKVELAKIAFKNVTTAQFSEFKKFQVRVDYESAYGEKFSYDSRNHLA